MLRCFKYCSVLSNSRYFLSGPTCAQTPTYLVKRLYAYRGSLVYLAHCDRILSSSSAQTRPPRATLDLLKHLCSSSRKHTLCLQKTVGRALVDQPYLYSSVMEDLLKPSDATFRSFYERGYRTWYDIWSQVVAADSSDNAADSGYGFLTQRNTIIPHHPTLPVGLEPDSSG